MNKEDAIKYIFLVLVIMVLVHCAPQNPALQYSRESGRIGAEISQLVDETSISESHTSLFNQGDRFLNLSNQLVVLDKDADPTTKLYATNEYLAVLCSEAGYDLRTIAAQTDDQTDMLLFKWRINAIKGQINKLRKLTTEQTS